MSRKMRLTQFCGLLPVICKFFRAWDLSVRAKYKAAPGIAKSPISPSKAGTDCHIEQILSCFFENRLS